MAIKQGEKVTTAMNAAGGKMPGDPLRTDLALFPC
jgi:hypothetical protein